MHFPALYSSCIYPEGAIDIFRDVQFKQIIPDLLSACWYQRCYHQLEKQQVQKKKSNSGETFAVIPTAVTFFCCRLLVFEQPA